MKIDLRCGLNYICQFGLQVWCYACVNNNVCFFFFQQRLQNLKLIYLVSIAFHGTCFQGERTVRLTVLTDVWMLMMDWLTGGQAAQNSASPRLSLLESWGLAGALWKGIPLILLLIWLPYRTWLLVECELPCHKTPKLPGAEEYAHCLAAVSPLFFI